MNRTKLRKILGVLDPTTRIDFTGFDNDLNKLKESLKQRVQPANFDPLVSSFNKLKASFETRNAELADMITGKQQELVNLINSSSQENDDKINQLNAEISVLQSKQIPDFGKQIKNTESKLIAMINNAKLIDDLQDEKEKQQIQIQFANFEKQVKDLKLQFQSRGGGSMNRKINFNGTDKLTRYTDINWKAGNNVTFTIANNNQTKMVDVTVASTGGSGSGIVRSIQNISASQNADASATTDYVYLCSNTMTLTMPDATTNSNLYTIKNVGSGTITINTTSAQTIDGSASIILPVQYTSVDLISDSANWGVT